MPVPLLRLASRWARGQGFFPVGDGGFALAQGQFETVLIDAEQHLTALDRLVVAHVHLLDQPGNVRGDLHNVGTDVTVAGPGGKHVIQHHPPDHDHGEAHDQQGQGHARPMVNKGFFMSSGID